MEQYDYIFCGAGASGLSLLTRMIDSGRFGDSRILLLEKDDKQRNDRTWCFWEQGSGYFDHLVFRRWQNLAFRSDSYASQLNISPYQYKMIRGIDFYRFCLEKIRQQPNITIRQAEIHSTKADKNGLLIDLGEEKLHTGKSVVFNSILPRLQKNKRELQLLQHFKGWTVRTDRPIFEPSKATLMDFRVHQRYGTSFVYVLPLDSTRALVEYTQFTPNLLPPETYDEELRQYLAAFTDAGNYEIEEEEFGVIPMTNRYFPFYSSGMYHIGMAGGQTKASTGYTFRFIQKQSDAIFNNLVNGKRPDADWQQPSRRFHFYDSVLLQLLSEKRLGGREIFTRLFRRNKPADIFRFLDNESRLREELKIISSLQLLPFMRAAAKHIIN